MKMYRHILCGAGPAGMGLIINAFIQNKARNLIKQGMAIIDRSIYPGAGAIGAYNISANSLGRVFTECLQETEALDDFRACQSYQDIKKYSNDAPDLKVIARFLGDLSNYFIGRLKSYGDLGLYFGYNVEYIELTSCGSFEVNVSKFNGNRTLNEKISCDNIFMNLGGRQDISHIARLEIVSGFVLSRYQEKIICSDEIIKMEENELISLLLRVGGGQFPEIAILGGSHSAFSVAIRLEKAFRNIAGENQQVSKPLIKIFHRNQLRFYFESEVEARANSYIFDQLQVVCHETGRVHRFGGLRHEAKKFAESLGRSPQTLVSVIHLDNNCLDVEEKLTQSLEYANLVVASLGYQANLVPILDIDKEPIRLARARDGGLETDGCGRVYREDGRVLKGLFSWGLGSGLRRSEATGGEPGFEGRIDGVWLYQHPIGAAILSEALSDTKVAAR